MRTHATRKQVQELLKARPFKPFVITLDNGQQAVIGHPENIAFEPEDNGEKGSDDFYVLTSGVRMFSTFDAISSIGHLDEWPPRRPQE